MVLYDLVQEWHGWQGSEHTKYCKLDRGTKHLLNRTSIPTECDITLHSMRIGGTCCLLKAGLSRNVVETLGNWKGTLMMGQYARMLSLRPSLFQGYAFYNPKELANMYSLPTGQ